MWRYHILILFSQIALHFKVKEAHSVANIDLQVNKSLVLPYVLKANVQGIKDQQRKFHYTQQANKPDRDRHHYNDDFETTPNTSRTAKHQLGETNWKRVEAYTSPIQTYNKISLGPYVAGSDRWINYHNHLPYTISTPNFYSVVLTTLLILYLGIASSVIIIATGLFPRLLASTGIALSSFYDFFKYNHLEIPTV
uniref:Uncharacterized protein n=1 Tax=Glossina pallidipes TaxID=7398 RepID=A0A1A9ZU95_GLOPL